MIKIRTIIADDEQHAREGLARILNEDPDIEVVNICSNGIEAIEAIRYQSIDLILLDIQMPGVNGFDVIRSIDPKRMPWIIFITAHQEYSLKAFEVHAIDYLLKPFTDDRFLKALDRAKELILQKKDRDHFLKVSNSENYGEGQIISANKDHRLILKEGGKVHFISHDMVRWIEAFDYYVKIHIEKSFYLIRTSLKKLENGLPKDFVRIHKSSIININYIKTIEHDGGETMVVLEDGTTRRVGRTYRQRLKDVY